MNFNKLTAVLAAALALTACGIDPNETTDGTGDQLAVNDEALTAGRFETFTGKDGKHYFHLLAGNNEKVLQSQGYTTAASAATGIKSVQANGINTNRYLVRESSDGRWYFVLTAANGAIIGSSEMYVSNSNAERAITTVSTIVKSTVASAPAPLAAKFEIFKGLDSKFYFHARAGNGEIVLQSQSYTTKVSATNGVDSVQTNGSIFARYSVQAAADGSYYFTLHAANGAVIAMGEMYDSKSNAQRGVETCVALLSAPLPR